MERNARLKSLFDTTGVGLEIGGGYNPLVPRREGYRVETVDHTDANGLREKYRAVGIDRIEDVDYVTDGRPIAEVIGATHRYDFIVASHVIEHVPNLVGFLRDCERLLKPGGVLVLAVPDKRFCFDVLRPVSTTGAVLQAYIEDRHRHPPGLVFDHFALNASRGGQVAWRSGETGAFALGETFQTARDFLETARLSDQYVDVHAWQFTPSRFRLLLRELLDLGLIGLRESRFVEFGGMEFFVTLSSAGAGCPLDRLTLATRSLSEEHGVTLTTPSAITRFAARAIGRVRRWWRRRS